MRPRDFENWSASLDTVRATVQPGVVVVEYVDEVERGAFAIVWNVAAERFGCRPLLDGEV